MGKKRETENGDRRKEKGDWRPEKGDRRRVGAWRRVRSYEL
jgi:hypothetical protein